MNISETIILSVVSGVITSAFIFLLIKIFYKIIIPWYKNTIYSGIDISGTWEEVILKNSDHMTLKLKQHERKVSGIAILKSNKEAEESKTTTLLINGHLQDGYLLLTLKNKDRKVQSLSTYLLKINGGGSKLNGQLSWVAKIDGEIHSQQITLNRMLV